MSTLYHPADYVPAITNGAGEPAIVWVSKVVPDEGKVYVTQNPNRHALPTQAYTYHGVILLELLDIEEPTDAARLKSAHLQLLTERVKTQLARKALFEHQAQVFEAILAHSCTDAKFVEAHSAHKYGGDTEFATFMNLSDPRKWGVDEMVEITDDVQYEIVFPEELEALFEKAAAADDAEATAESPASTEDSDVESEPSSPASSEGAAEPSAPAEIPISEEPSSPTPSADEVALDLTSLDDDASDSEEAQIILPITPSAPSTALVPYARGTKRAAPDDDLDLDLGDGRPRLAFDHMNPNKRRCTSPDSTSASCGSDDELGPRYGGAGASYDVDADGEYEWVHKWSSESFSRPVCMRVRKGACHTFHFEEIHGGEGCGELPLFPKPRAARAGFPVVGARMNVGSRGVRRAAPESDNIGPAPKRLAIDATDGNSRTEGAGNENAAREMRPRLVPVSGPCARAEFLSAPRRLRSATNSMMIRRQARSPPRASTSSVVATFSSACTSSAPTSTHSHIIPTIEEPSSDDDDQAFSDEEAPSDDDEHSFSHPSTPSNFTPKDAVAEYLGTNAWLPSSVRRLVTPPHAPGHVNLGLDDPKSGRCSICGKTVMRGPSALVQHALRHIEYEDSASWGPDGRVHVWRCPCGWETATQAGMERHRQARGHSGGRLASFATDTMWVDRKPKAVGFAGRDFILRPVCD
ncbi:hypothetical protein EV714DRAFT_274970 [Schizophyllum commune]